MLPHRIITQRLRTTLTVLTNIERDGVIVDRTLNVILRDIEGVTKKLVKATQEAKK